MPKLNLDAIPQTNATGYPAPFDAPVAESWYRRLAPVTGLTDFAASHVVLKPGPGHHSVTGTTARTRWS